MHTHIQTYRHIYICTYTHTNIHTYTHTNTYTQAYTHTDTYNHIHTYKGIHTHMHIYTHAHTNACTHVYIHIQIHTHPALPPQQELTGESNDWECLCQVHRTQSESQEQMVSILSCPPRLKIAAGRQGGFTLQAHNLPCAVLPRCTDKSTVLLRIT